VGDVNNPARGISSAAFREVTCKDCLREQETGHRPISDEDLDGEPPLQFEYSESWANRMLDRGGSRTDRCLRHRKLHRQTIQGLAVPYVDLQTIGEILDRENPTGPLGGLGRLPATHTPKEIEVDLGPRKFGMTDDDIRGMLELLSEKRVLILRAGTGTGKSTFGPFRLMSPPPDSALRLTDFGTIVVTEPRVQATIGVATFVGEKLVAGCPWKVCDVHGRFVPGGGADEHPGPIADECTVVDCSDHIGPGYPVGYQVKGDKRHDESCNLVFVTDGTMVSWLGQGRLSKIGTVIIDEAHERSNNIDFILGYLKREMDRYPHLRVIVTSATFDVDYFVDYFGGEDRVASMDIPAVKSFGYGSPLFPLDGDQIPCHCDDEADDYHGPITDFDTWLKAHWVNQHGPEIDGRPAEDLWETTRKIHALRSTEIVPEDSGLWRETMAGALARQVVQMINGLDAEEIHGDILAFLPSEKLINEAIEIIREEISPERVDVYGLLASMSVGEKEVALASRPFEARRRVLVASNIAETSLTIEGIRFVVDSGLITQGVWDPVAASASVPTTPHSRAGIRQRWGRVGRDAPGWVFPLYGRRQFDALAADTAPGSTRANLEQLIMTAKVGGVDDVEAFPWPAAHPYDPEKLDESARGAMEGFEKERLRASVALAASGSIDGAGDATPLGKELQRFTADGSPDFAMAVMFADQLACVPETVTAMCLLEGKQLSGASDAKNPKLLRRDIQAPLESRLQAAMCHAALFAGCRDDLDFAIRVMAAWERADPDVAPWVPSKARRAWADRWWIDDARLVEVAEKRRATLETLSPAMREEVKRFLDMRLVPRTRAILSRVLATKQYVAEGQGSYRAVHATDDDQAPASVFPGVRLAVVPERVIALKRDTRPNGVQIQNLVAVEEWACEAGADGGPADAFELLARSAERCSPRSADEREVDPLLPYLLAWPVGGRFQCEFDTSAAGETHISAVSDVRPPVGYPRDPEEPLAEWTLPDEIETRWPGNSRPEEDEEALEAKLVLDPNDDENDREKGLEVNDYPDTSDLVSIGEAVDVLADWEEHAVEVSRPAVRVDGAGGNPHWESDGWFEVTGYEVGTDGKVEVVLESASLPPDMTPSYPDFEPGREIVVTVGEMIDIAGISCRAFWRTDGNGRFLLAQRRRTKGAPTDAPASLNDDNGDLPGRLGSGDVIPAEVTSDWGGMRSITLVPFLAGQLEAALDDDGFLPAVALTELDGRESGARWGEVELLVTDPAGARLHTFAVYPRVNGLRGEVFPEGAEVRVRLGLRNERDRASLASREHCETLRELATEHPAVLLFEAADAGTSGGRLTCHWSVGEDLRDALLRVDDDPEWQRSVWVFYACSYERAVDGLRSGVAGESRVVPLGRARSKPPVSVSGPIPQPWIDPQGGFGRQQRALSAACGGRVSVSSAGEVQVSWDEPNAAEKGIEKLRDLLAQPVATIAVPAEAKGAIIGKGGANIKRLGELDGIFSCSLTDDPVEVRVVGRDSASLRDAIDDIVALTGIYMTVPDERLNGLLIGKGGATVKELREASGCSHAGTERGSPKWILRGPSGASVKEFLRLANERVPGCQLGRPVMEAAVRDSVQDVSVDDWADHEFAQAQLPPDWQDTFDKFAEQAQSS
jgi:HrpA-like RNA helicase